MRTEYIRFNKESAEGKALLQWYKGLEDKKGDRARLRRCKTLVEASYSAYAHQLAHQLMKLNDRVSRDRIVLIAAILSHVTETDSHHSLPVQLASSREGSDQAVLSELRFRRLLQSDDREELCQHLRRAIAQLRGKADIFSIANAVYSWNDWQRRRWANDYFDAGSIRKNLASQQTEEN